MERKRCIYSKEALQAALTGIKNGLSYTKASYQFGIPKTTLIDKMHKKYNENATPGAPTILTAEEEAHIVNWILHLGAAGFPVTKTQLLESVSILVNELKRPNPFKNGMPGRHWYEGFLNRHPEVCHRTS